MPARSFVGILAAHFGASTTYLCRGGATSETGADWCADFWRTPPRPDLVVISYGMNDQTLGRSRLRRRVLVEPRRYRRTSSTSSGESGSVRTCPRCSCPAARTSGLGALEQQDARVPRGSAGAGEPLADVPSVWTDSRLLIVNGMNHPGDEGHRLIARACLDALGVSREENQAERAGVGQRSLPG